MRGNYIEENLDYCLILVEKNYESIGHRKLYIARANVARFQAGDGLVSPALELPATVKRQVGRLERF